MLIQPVLYLQPKSSFADVAVCLSHQNEVILHLLQQSMRDLTSEAKPNNIYSIIFDECTFFPSYCAAAAEVCFIHPVYISVK